MRSVTRPAPGLRFGCLFPRHLWPLCLVIGILYPSLPAQNQIRPENTAGRPPYRAEIEQVQGGTPGGLRTVGIMARTGSVAIQGFTFSLAYDSVALHLESIEPGRAMSRHGRQALSWRLTERRPGEAIYPFCYLRVETVTDDHSAVTRKDGDAFDGELVRLVFRITDNRAVNCRFLPLQFVWRASNDNVIFTGQNHLPNFVNRVLESHSQFPAADSGQYPIDSGTAAAEPFLPSGDRVDPTSRTVDFVNGGIQVQCSLPSSTDMIIPGDVDQNGFPGREGDITRLTELILRQGVDAAERRNVYGFRLGYAPDGTPLVLESVVSLLRIMRGDTLAPPRPLGDIVLCSIRRYGDTLVVWANATTPLGGVLAVFDASDSTLSPHPGYNRDGIALDHLFLRNRLRVLVFDTTGRGIPGGGCELLRIPGGRALSLVSLAAVNRASQPIKGILLD